MARKWSHLVIHHTATGPRETVASITAMHRRRGFTTIGYHYLIERSGTRGYLKAARPDSMAGAHCPGINTFGIGLSVVGYFHPGSPHSEHMSEALYQDVLGAAVHVCRKYNIPASNVKFHREMKATACPGDWFPMARLRAEVAAALAK